MPEKAHQGIWPSFAPLGYINMDGANGKRTTEQCATGKISLKPPHALS